MYKNINNKLFLLKNIKKSKNFNNNFKIKFIFTSLISPFFLNNLRLNFNYFNYNKKIYIKQSYILLTWLYYLSFVNQKKNNKNRIKFFILPIKNNKFTLTKAPIAHKNWSKEQYNFNYYRFIISLKFFLRDENKINSINESLFFILLTKKNFPFFETNLFFLKNVKFFLSFNDHYYFNYYIYNLKKKFK